MSAFAITATAIGSFIFGTIIYAFVLGRVRLAKLQNVDDD